MNRKGPAAPGGPAPGARFEGSDRRSRLHEREFGGRCRGDRRGPAVGQQLGDATRRTGSPPGGAGRPRRSPDRTPGIRRRFCQLERLGRDGHLALLINAYNAFTLRLILDHYPLGSIRDIPAAQRWSARRWHLGGRTVSLDQIENEMIRPNFQEPRIHFALVCAAIGCPRLRPEAYVGERLDAQLANQSRYVHSHDRWCRFDADRGRVGLTRLYEWYATDLEQAAGSVLAFVGRQAPVVQEAMDSGVRLEISYLPYDWGLNAQD